MENIIFLVEVKAVGRGGAALLRLARAEFWVAKDVVDKMRNAVPSGAVIP